MSDAAEDMSGEQENLLSGVEAPEPEGTGGEPEGSVRTNDQGPRDAGPEGAEHVRDTAGTADTENDPNNQEPERPEWLPEKFKSPEDLAKSYQELEKKLNDKNEPPEAYEVELPEGMDGLSEDDEAAFKDMGLTNDQAQKLVNFFYENVVPELQEARTEVEKQRLASAWNMKSADSHEFQQRLTEVKSWASRNLPEQAVNEMAKTHNGIAALYQMMQTGMQANQQQGGPEGRPGKQELQDLMNDQRYINREPDFMEYVNKKFREAYD